MTERPRSSWGREPLLDLYDALVRAREAEERLELLHRQGHVGGGVYRGLGQEAGAVGTAYALRRREDGTGDFLAQTIRETGALFLFGGTPLDYFRQYTAKATSPTAGKEANVHFTDFDRGFIGPVSPLGTMVEVMAGITLSFRLRKEDRVGVVFYGDGASSTGAWHEGLCFAAAQRCPMLLVVEANQWAFSTPTRKQTRVESFADKAPAYGVNGVSVDGTDVLAVHDAVSAAADRARSGEGTQLIELRYYRRLGHAQHDPQDYVDPEEVALWATRDPVDRYRGWLVEHGWAEAVELDERRARIHDEIHDAAEQAVHEPLPDGPEARTDVYTDGDASEPWTRRVPADPRTPPSGAGRAGGQKRSSTKT
jgi:pyruvate dehydrogenase E1 component alpha subunit/2-oxoisovalerate dehydrogenase E1 component alpha subunit